MQKMMLGFLGFAFIFVLAIPGGFRAQMQNASPHLPRGTATDINSSEIDALVRRVAAVRVSDQAIRVVTINGEYNVSIGVVSRLKTSGKEAPSGIEHAQITEIYHVISGNGTLVTGGTVAEAFDSLYYLERACQTLDIMNDAPAPAAPALVERLEKVEPGAFRASQ